MLEKAIEKIKAEMEQAKNNSYVQVVGGFLLQYLAEKPEIAEKILAEGKTVAKSYEEARKAAEKVKVGNCGILSDYDVFAIVFRYFGVEPVGLASSSVPVTVKQSVPAPEVKKPVAIDFDLDVEDLL